MRVHSVLCRHVAVVLFFLTSVASPQAAESGFPVLSTIQIGGGSGAAATSFDGLTGAPTIANPNAVPTYPPPTIPPTADAPFMQKSSLPSGTVFICAGAVLGGLLTLVVIWRAWVAWSIRRNMRRITRGYVSLAQQGPPHSTLRERGVQLLKKSNLFYQQQDPGSMISMKLLSNEEQQAPQKKAYGHAPDKRSLFFSPTASSGLLTVGLGSRKDSEYLPSGYYAARPEDSSQSRSVLSIQSSEEGDSEHQQPRGDSPVPLIAEIGHNGSAELLQRSLSAHRPTDQDSVARSSTPRRQA